MSISMKHVHVYTCTVCHSVIGSYQNYSVYSTIDSLTVILYTHVLLVMHEEDKNNWHIDSK